MSGTALVPYRGNFEEKVIVIITYPESNTQCGSVFVTIRTESCKATVDAQAVVRALSAGIRRALEMSFLKETGRPMRFVDWRPEIEYPAVYGDQTLECRFELKPPPSLHITPYLFTHLCEHVFRNTPIYQKKTCIVFAEH